MVAHRLALREGDDHGLPGKAKHSTVSLGANEGEGQSESDAV